MTSDFTNTMKKEKKYIMEAAKMSKLPDFFKLADGVESELMEIIEDGIYEYEITLLLEKKSYYYASGYCFKNTLEDEEGEAINTIFINFEANGGSYNDETLFEYWKNCRENKILCQNQINGKEKTIMEMMADIKDDVKGEQPAIVSNIFSYISQFGKIVSNCNKAKTVSDVAANSSLPALIYNLNYNQKNAEQDVEKATADYEDVRTNTYGLKYYDYFNSVSTYFDNKISATRKKNGFYGLLTVYTEALKENSIFGFTTTINSEDPAEYNGKQLTSDGTEKGANLTIKQFFSNYTNAQGDDIEQMAKYSSEFNIDDTSIYDIATVTNIDPRYGYTTTKSDGTITVLEDHVSYYCRLVNIQRRANYVKWVNNYLALCAMVLGEEDYNKIFNTTNGYLKKQDKTSLINLLQSSTYFDLPDNYTSGNYEYSILGRKLLIYDYNINVYEKDIQTGDYIETDEIDKNVARQKLVKYEKCLIDFLLFMLSDDTTEISRTLSYAGDVDNSSSNIADEDKWTIYITSLDPDIETYDNEYLSKLVSTNNVKTFKSAFLAETYIDNYSNVINKQISDIFGTYTTTSKDINLNDMDTYKYETSESEEFAIKYSEFVDMYKYITDSEIKTWFKNITTWESDDFLQDEILAKVVDFCSQPDENKDADVYYHALATLICTEELSGISLYTTVLYEIENCLGYISTYYNKEKSVWYNYYDRLRMMHANLDAYEVCNAKLDENVKQTYYSNVGNDDFDFSNCDCVAVDFWGKVTPEQGYMVVNSLKSDIQQYLGFMHRASSSDEDDSRVVSDENTGDSAGFEGFKRKNTKAKGPVVHTKIHERYTKENSVYYNFTKYGMLLEMLQFYQGVYKRYLNALFFIFKYYGMWFNQLINNNTTLFTDFFKHKDSSGDNVVPSLDYKRRAFTNILSEFEMMLYNTYPDSKTDPEIRHFSEDWEANKETIRAVLTIAGSLSSLTLNTTEHFSDKTLYMSNETTLKAPSTENDITIGQGISSSDSYNVATNGMVSILNKTYAITEISAEATEFENYAVYNGVNYYSQYYIAKNKYEEDNGNAEAIKDYKTAKENYYNALSRASNIFYILSYANGGENIVKTVISDIKNYASAIAFILYVNYNNSTIKTSQMFNSKIIKSDYVFNDVPSKNGQKSDDDYLYIDYLINMLYYNTDDYNIYAKENPVQDIINNIKQISNDKITSELPGNNDQDKANNYEWPQQDSKANYNGGISKRGLIVIYAFLAATIIHPNMMYNAENYDTFNYWWYLYGKGSDANSTDDDAKSRAAIMTELENGTYSMTEDFLYLYNKKYKNLKEPFNNSFLYKIMSREFNIFKEKSRFGENEYFISPNTGKKVYTYFNGIKQKVDYRREGVSREAFQNFLNRSDAYYSQKVAQNNQKAVKFEQNREKFVQSGEESASISPNGTITGPSLFTNQILENGQTWKEIKNGVEKTKVATDGVNILGAGPGNGYDGAMKSHIKNMEILESANNEFNTPEMLKQITKNINNDLVSTPENALYNRGNQTKSKIIDLPDRAVGVLPEKYYPERCKNRNIYKTKEIIPIAGFDINEARIGENLMETHSVAHLKRNHGRRTPVATPTGALLEQQFGGVVPTQFNATVGAEIETKEGFAQTASPYENNINKQFKGSDGANYWMPKKFVH